MRYLGRCDVDEDVPAPQVTEHGVHVVSELLLFDEVQQLRLQVARDDLRGDG